MIKAILFDLDNTLVDFMKMKKKSCEAAVDAMIGAGLKIKKDQALEIIYEIYGRKGIEHQLIFQKFLKKAVAKIDYRILAYGILAYKKVRDLHLFPYSEAISVLKELKGKYKLAIISDAPSVPAWIRLVQMELDNFFDVVITKGDVRKQKTSLTPFKRVLKELNVKPEEALMVGDNIERDIKMPKKLGIKTCFARYGRDYEEPIEASKSTADFEINNLRELLGVVEKV